MGDEVCKGKPANQPPQEKCHVAVSWVALGFPRGAPELSWTLLGCSGCFSPLLAAPGRSSCQTPSPTQKSQPRRKQQRMSRCPALRDQETGFAQPDSSKNELQFGTVRGLRTGLCAALCSKQVAKFDHLLALGDLRRQEPDSSNFPFPKFSSRFLYRKCSTSQFAGA